ncbi:glutathione S-transferase family protein [Leeia sp. TBRC 13508]|uniref:Glutathione S-transferase family protein n=1 Tax=Leeia speluncae TaxID=2884804 RepID=A0ABS8D1Y9_9NEIS|nr:glutathione S-transferase family protein [Leeia speluncae]MCB6182219.1 glutathione S-transferase family protein [Leeia speluncae]
MLTLYIGNKNYSSWSLRPWLVMAHFGIPFKEQMIPLYTPEGTVSLRNVSPSGKVPLLKDDSLLVNDSLAICEYLAEQFPTLGLWPKDSAARAVARSVSAEMHSGFMSVRQHMPMNVKGSYPGEGLSNDVQKDIDRIVTIWQDCRQKHGAAGPWLFGQFSIADAMYAPIAFRFKTYGVKLPTEAETYLNTLLSHPSMQEWVADALKEPWTISAAEPYAQSSLAKDTADS